MRCRARSHLCGAGVAFESRDLLPSQALPAKERGDIHGALGSRPRGCREPPARLALQALEVLRSPGTCATLGLAGLENEVTIDQGHLLIGRTLTGVIEGDADPQQFIPELAELWRDGRFPIDRLVKRFPFAELNAAISALAGGEVIKPVVVFE